MLWGYPYSRKPPFYVSKIPKGLIEVLLQGIDVQKTEAMLPRQVPQFTLRARNQHLSRGLVQPVVDGGYMC